jgi:hypothetical protein
LSSNRSSVVASLELADQRLGPQREPYGRVGHELVVAGLAVVIFHAPTVREHAEAGAPARRRRAPGPGTRRRPGAGRPERGRARPGGPERPAPGRRRPAGRSPAPPRRPRAGDLLARSRVCTGVCSSGPAGGVPGTPDTPRSPWPYEIPLGAGSAHGPCRDRTSDLGIKVRLAYLRRAAVDGRSLSARAFTPATNRGEVPSAETNPYAHRYAHPG